VIVTPLDRRRADRFAALLDDTGDASGPAQLTALLEVTRTLQRVPINGDIDPEFRDRLRGRLLAVATVRPAEPSTDHTADLPARHRAPGHAPRPGGQPRRLVVLGGIVASLLTTCGVVAASTGAAPGSPLYGVKQATESAQLALAGSGVPKGRLYLGFARTRISEAQQVRGDSTRLISTLGAMDSATRHGAQVLTGAAITSQDQAPLDALDTFLGSQRADLAALLPGLTDPRAHARAVQSMALLDRLRARATALRATLPCAVPSRAASDDLGPLPAACGATHSRPGEGTSPGGRPATGPGTAGGPSASGETSPPKTQDRPRRPRIPGTGATPSPGTGSQGQPADVGSVVTGVLGQVLGTIGVSPPPLPPPPLPLPPLLP